MVWKRNPNRNLCSLSTTDFINEIYKKYDIILQEVENTETFKLYKNKTFEYIFEYIGLINKGILFRIIVKRKELKFYLSLIKVTYYTIELENTYNFADIIEWIRYFNLSSYALPNINDYV